MQVSTEHKIKYLERRHQEWNVAEQALAKKDLTPIAEMGHKWKGNGETFGFPELGSLGARLEMAASQSQFDEVATLINQFKNWLMDHPIVQ